jgi:hypothetical protein
MDNTTIKNIFKFLEDEGEHRTPLKFKLLNNIPLTKEELIVDDDLYLFDSKITSLPEGLKVGGYLDLGFCPNLTSLPKGLEVGEKLSLMYSKIESLPEGLKVGGYLNLSDCKKLTSLPKGLKVGSILNITDSTLTKYTDDELFKMIEPNGYIKRGIKR